MTRKHTFPAGEYYIGDPCYVIPDKEWTDLLERTGCFGIHNAEEKDWDDGIYQWGDKRCFVAFTAHGDGCYGNRKEDEIIGVDSGTIGIIPMPRTDNDKDGLPIIYAMFVTFGRRFQVWEEDGVFHFGSKIKINTN